MKHPLPRVQSLILLSAAALTTLACGRPSTPAGDVDSTVRFNAVAADHHVWEGSDRNPTRVFERWRHANASAKDVCDAFKSRSDDELTLFEEEFRRRANETLLQPCKAQLTAKLERYWAEHLRSAANALKPGMRFRRVIERRDFSQGGFIVTADLKPKQVLLTFDDGPHGQYTDMILAALRKVDAHAVFFHMGRNVRANPEIVKRVAAAGHSIGSHSMTHSCLPSTSSCERNNGRRLTFAEATAEIVNGHAAVQRVLGWVDPFFRFPYGASSVELKKFVAERATGEFFWSIDSNDWRAQPPAAVVHSIMTALKGKGNRGVVLMHDIQRRTAVALPHLLKELHKSGYTPVILRSARPQDRYNSGLLKGLPGVGPRSAASPAGRTNLP